MQLGSRTGSSPAPDFAGMVDEDLLLGQVNGESMRSFLPEDLLKRLPPEKIAGKRIIAELRKQLGEAALRKRLIAWFFELGEAEMEKVEARWNAHGLDFQRRGAMGMALQRILVTADKEVYSQALKKLHGNFVITNSYCALHLTQPIEVRFQSFV